MPFEIHPEVPKEGKKVSDLFVGVSVENMFGNISHMGKKYGINFCGADFISNSRMALLASEYAKDKGKFHDFHSKIFYMYFAEGKNIADKDVLSSIAGSIGLNSEEMFNKIEEGTYENHLKEAQKIARNFNVNSTPTFIIDGKHVLVGAQPIEKFKEVLNNKVIKF